ncbi:MurR/RpiR family transcriptional regulator [Heyndrickxia coagulans]|uniref:Transcriptional regulator, RpiR family n=1 Tax=Heyndrickxia coagulans DSM 1 = ATCC 7050 TaxID=1121088 RepID=A0A8B4BXR6_HEYCO|nr:MurR/RpiR family transcriptional regulator [Heyndrickxia coagulans]AJH80122.1 SIS domain protein [Heyndrickxia coagulans DSM 1 = ATCC 7050]MCR2847383.1 MurR/RpiR family transcriptional regulator [Heyndrickxia coagulans]MDR4225058.1 MurR/RpiR family transcriptional regulator [Heyndrickxia coagulans DSM 1 = ATCC 7050]MED4495287.1 MurR/RpiR family transcriptional regulator [Heyndrickxia coagulans]MED4536528.1 MurR/RpiR family transcriptional regulator [Heyndrickxia coagulans]
MELEENIILQIKSKLSSLSKSEKKLGKYILSHAVETVNDNTSELAKKAGVSPATVVRFCRSIGLSGFSQLKIRLYADASGLDREIYTDITSNEDIAMIADKLALRFNQSITQTANLLETGCIEKITAMVDKSPAIYVYGIGASHVAAEDFMHKFSRIGKPVVHTLDHHLLGSSLINASKDSMFVAISNSGETNEVIKLTQIAKQNGLFTAGITQKRDSTLARIVDVPLIHHGGEAVLLRSAATTSLAAQLFTIDVLYFAYVARHYEEIMHRLKNSKINIQTFFRKENN